MWAPHGLRGLQGTNPVPGSRASLSSSKVGENAEVGSGKDESRDKDNFYSEHFVLDGLVIFFLTGNLGRGRRRPIKPPTGTLCKAAAAVVIVVAKS